MIFEPSELPCSSSPPHRKRAGRAIPNRGRETRVADHDTFSSPPAAAFVLTSDCACSRAKSASSTKHAS